MNNSLKPLFFKELKDFFRHPQSLAMFSIVLFMNILLSFAIGELFVEMTVNMSLVMIGFYCPAFLTTEEKEKKTLTALLLTPISTRSIIFGKAVFYTFATFVVTMAIVIYFHWKETYLISSILAILVGSFFVSILGIGVGLIAKKQSEVSAIGTILLLYLFLPELLYGVKPIISMIALTLPIHHILGAIRAPFLSFEFFKFFSFLVLFTGVLFIWVKNLAADVLLTEDNKFKIGRRDSIFLVSLIIISFFSINIFSEPKVLMTKIENDTYLEYPMKDFKIPFNDSRYDFKQKKLLQKPILILTNKENKGAKIRIIFKKLLKEENLDFHKLKYIEELTKNGDLKVQESKIDLGGKDVHILSYEGTQGLEKIYLFEMRKVLIKVTPELKLNKTKSYQETVNDTEFMIRHWK
ncbi:MAG: ABC-2 type transport system permease protein [Bacteriovoracaceae bacterium]|jgi:ABC-2 type transport system permease protein